MKFELYLAKVISINDVDGKGKIQVKPFPLMNDLLDATCPWVRPFAATAGSVTSPEYNVNIPPVDSIVWVMDFDNFVHNSFYLPYSTLDGILSIATDVTTIGTDTGLTMGNSYDITLNKTEDGTIIFRNKKTGALGILHGSGAFITISASGDIVFKSDSSSTTGKIEIESTTGAITISGNVTMTGGSLTTGATSSCVPTGTGGFLGIKTCLYAGAPICGDTITTTV